MTDPKTCSEFPNLEVIWTQVFPIHSHYTTCTFLPCLVMLCHTSSKAELTGLSSGAKASCSKTFTAKGKRQVFTAEPWSWCPPPIVQLSIRRFLFLCGVNEILHMLPSGALLPPREQFPTQHFKLAQGKAETSASQQIMCKNVLWYSGGGGIPNK